MKLFLMLSLCLLLASCASGPAQPLMRDAGLKKTTVDLQSFMLINYHPLSEDIILGKGEYLQAVFYMAKIDTHQQKKIVENLLILLESEPSRYTFSLKILKLLQDNTSPELG